MTPSLRLEGEARTHVGLVRAQNEDSMLARPDIGLWLVADGMGGHEAGAWASACITEAVAEVGGPPDLDVRLTRVADAIHGANMRIFEAAQKRGTQMGSTVVALLIVGQRFAVVWAGDSRAYLLRDGELLQLTVDHSQVQQLVDNGLLSAEEAETHPMSHVLARAVGVERTLALDAIHDMVAVGDRFLICSDGLTGPVPAADLHARLATGTPAEAADALVALCLERGAPDNVTLAVVDVRESTMLAFDAPGDAE